jgi:hypothetical protein
MLSRFGKRRPQFNSTTVKVHQDRQEVLALGETTEDTDAEVSANRPV